MSPKGPANRLLLPILLEFFLGGGMLWVTPFWSLKEWCQSQHRKVDKSITLGGKNLQEVLTSTKFVHRCVRLNEVKIS